MVEVTQRLIVNSAIMYPDGDVVTGRRHSDVIATMAKLGIMSKSECIQGFVDNTGKFYTRQEARELCINNGQLPETHEGELYSEDLWPGPLEREEW